MIYQRKDTPFWWYKFSINGKKYVGSTKRLDKKSATRFAVEKHNALLNASQFGIRPTISIGEAMDAIIAVKADRTAESYDLQRRRLTGGFPAIHHLDGSAGMHSLDKQSLLKLYTARHREGLSANSRNREMAFLRQTYLWCRKHGYEVAPDLSFDLDRVTPKSRFLTPQEIIDVQASLGGLHGDAALRATDLLVFLVDTGARLNEALALKWQRCDFTARMIYLWRFKGDMPSPVGMTSRVFDMLQRKRNQEAPFVHMDRAVKLLREAIDTVCNGDPQIVSTNGKATVHSLRDTFASRLVQANMSLHKVGSLLGHRSLISTKKYAHLALAQVADEGVGLLEGN